MSVQRATTGGGTGTSRRLRPRAVLAVLAGSQLLIVLDATIVTVALPAIRADLALDDAGLQWVVSAYTLTFGGFLLVGGRLADRLGRRRAFLAGMGAFAVASVACAVAPSVEVLVAGRALQGLAAAALAPAGLSLLMTAFPAGRARDRALGVWAGVSASGTAAGLILGGVLTRALSWEWVFWVGVPVAVAALAGAALLIGPDAAAEPAAFDVLGAVLATGGLIVGVHTLVGIPDAGWSSVTIVGLCTTCCLLGAFLAVEVRGAAPLVPRHLMANRHVLGADLAGLVFGAAIWAVFYVLSLFMGEVLGYDALRTGVAFLPLAAATAVAAAAAGRVLARVGPRPLLVGGPLLAAAGFGVLATLHPGVSYPMTLLPGLTLVGAGLGVAVVALTTAAVGTADPADRGIASGLFNAAQQIGGALGVAGLTAASTAYARAAGPGTAQAAAVVAGWGLALAAAAGLMLLTAVALAVLRPSPA